MNNLAMMANDFITYKGLSFLELYEHAKEIEQAFIDDYARNKAEKLINNGYCLEYEDFINEITWIDLELAKRFFKLEKKLLTYKRIDRLRRVMKSVLLELAIQYYKNNFDKAIIK